MNETTDKITALEKSLNQRRAQELLAKKSKYPILKQQYNNKGSKINKQKFNGYHLDYKYLEILRDVNRLGIKSLPITKTKNPWITKYNLLVKIHMLKIVRADKYFIYYEITSVGKKIIKLINKKQKLLDNKRNYFAKRAKVYDFLTWSLVGLAALFGVIINVAVEIILGIFAIICALINNHYSNKADNISNIDLSERICLPILQRSLSQHQFQIALQVFRANEMY